MSPATSSESEGEDDDEGMEDMEGMEGLLDTFDPEASEHGILYTGNKKKLKGMCA